MDMEPIPYAILANGVTALGLLSLSLFALWRGMLYTKPQVDRMIASMQEVLAHKDAEISRIETNAKHWREAHAASETVRSSTALQVEELADALGKLADREALSVEIMQVLRREAAQRSMRQET